jgi:hypothetical protein
MPNWIWGWAKDGEATKRHEPIAATARKTIFRIGKVLFNNRNPTPAHKCGSKPLHFVSQLLNEKTMEAITFQGNIKAEINTLIA